MIQSQFQLYEMTRKCGARYANDSVKDGKVRPKLIASHNEKRGYKHKLRRIPKHGEMILYFIFNINAQRISVT